MNALLINFRHNIFSPCSKDESILGWTLCSYQKIGPVNWAFQNNESGKSKIVYHNLIKPAKRKKDANFVPSHGLTPGDSSEQVPKLHVLPKSTLPRIPQLDHVQFSQNVFSNPQTSGNIVQTPTSGQKIIRYGRACKPVQRRGIT